MAGFEQPKGLSHDINAAGNHNSFIGARGSMRFGASNSSLHARLADDFSVTARGGFRNFLWRGGARRLGVRGDYALGRRKEYFADLGDGFVAHGAENENQRAPFVVLRERGAQRPSSRG